MQTALMNLCKIGEIAAIVVGVVLGIVYLSTSRFKKAIISILSCALVWALIRFVAVPLLSELF